MNQLKFNYKWLTRWFLTCRLIILIVYTKWVTAVTQTPVRHVRHVPAYLNNMRCYSWLQSQAYWYAVKLAFSSVSGECWRRVMARCDPKEIKENFKVIFQTKMIVSLTSSFFCFLGAWYLIHAAWVHNNYPDWESRCNRWSENYNDIFLCLCLCELNQ